MSRREALVAAALPAAVALNAIGDAASAAPMPAADPALDLWRRWNATMDAASAARERADLLLYSLSPDLRATRARMYRISERLAELGDARNADRIFPMTPDQVEAARARLIEEYEAGEAAFRGTGWLEAEEEATALEDARYDIEHAIPELDGDDPATVGLKLHLQLDCAGLDTRDPDWRFAMGLLRPLLPKLPAEMRAGIEALIESAKANAVRLAEREAAGDQA
jgi:hypothetical protein